ncbi:MAG TPA: hypothetical protein VN724_14505, partial [Pyrinomonadaceae bacterium]|nr:hypothetical protein [Pyrinomonadaceae bacterium]
MQNVARSLERAHLNRIFSSTLDFVKMRGDRLERGQARFLTCSILSRANVEWNLNRKIKQVRKRGLPPLVEKEQQHTNTPRRKMRDDHFNNKNSQHLSQKKLRTL